MKRKLIHSGLSLLAATYPIEHGFDLEYPPMQDSAKCCNFSRKAAR